MKKTSGQLILSEEPMHRMQWRRPVPSSGIAVVGKTLDGKYEAVPQLGLMTRYRLRFEVDVADHHDVVRCSLPSRGDVYSFDGILVLDWRVTDAAAVVERKIENGLSLCCARLHEQLRNISRGFDVEDCARAESKINQVVGAALPMSLPEGITVHRFCAQLNMDEGTLKAIRELRTARHEGSLAAIKSGGEQEVRNIEQEGSLRRQEQRIEAVRAAMRGNYDLVAIHLSQHPDDTSSLINMIRSDYQTSEDRRDRMIMEMLQRNLIQDIDVVDFNSALLGSATQRFRSGPQHTITLPHLPALPSTPTSAPDAPPAVPDTTTGADRVQRPDTSGVVGWRRLPRRDGDDAHD